MCLITSNTYSTYNLPSDQTKTKSRQVHINKTAVKTGLKSSEEAAVFGVMLIKNKKLKNSVEPLHTDIRHRLTIYSCRPKFSVRYRLLKLLSIKHIDKFWVIKPVSTYTNVKLFKEQPDVFYTAGTLITFSAS